MQSLSNYKQRPLSGAGNRANYDMEVSEFEIEVVIEDDTDKLRLNALNFRDSET